MSNGRICPLSTRDVVDRCLAFIEAFTNRNLYTYQSLFCRRVIESVLDGEGAIITGLWARQAGKSQAIASVCVGLAVLLPTLAKQFPDDPRLSPFEHGFWAGVYAPVKDQAEVPFRRMREFVTSEHGKAFLADAELSIRQTVDRADTIGLSNGSEIIARSASPDTNIEGKTHHAVFLEEAQKLSRSKVEKEIRPFLASTNGSMIMIGTAWESRGGFHNNIQQNVEKYQKGGKRNHFEFPYDIIVAEKRKAYEKDGKSFHLNYEKFVDNEIAQYGGKDTHEFKMNFMCLWQESRVIAIRASSLAAAAVGDLECGFRSGSSYQVAGLDVGKVNDVSVLTLMNVDTHRPIKNPFHTQDADESRQNYYVKTIVDWLELGGSFEGQAGQYRRLVEYLFRTNVRILVVDSTAIGDPVFERINDMIGENVACVPYKFTTPSKSNLYKYYLQELHSGRIKYAAGPRTRQRAEYRKFVQEHGDLDKEEWSGYVVCRAPDGGHDDYPDSAALACWAEKLMDDVTTPEIEVVSDWGGNAGGFLGSTGTDDASLFRGRRRR